MPLLDNLFTSTILPLYSLRLINIIRNAGVRFESFPIIICDLNGEPLSTTYEIFLLLEIHPMLDVEASDGNVPGLKGAKPQDVIGVEINRLVLKEENSLIEPPLLFRLQELENFVLIHEKLKQELEKNNISGCLYKRPEDIRAGPKYAAAIAASILRGHK